ncbi:hypothetical protein C8R45DRAFT_1219786 [Mycena sanguinolenta]|nr:hypothetical protein C8R45DRAFT_1219786 [Mycena sanguinolenta]
MGLSSNGILLISVISSWLNIALYTLELVLCVRYFQRPSRPRIHQIGVGALIIFDTLCTAATCTNAGAAVVPLPTTSFRLLLLPLAIQIITTYISSMISQLFLCNLFFVLTGSKMVTGAMLVLIFVHLAFSWASAVIMLKDGSAMGFSFTATTVGAISCAATDVIIAVCLAWKFWRMMAGTNSKDRRSTRNLLRRILILTVSSGAICAGNTLLMMILLLKDSAGFDFFFSCQGRVYALTLLGNFLVGIPTRIQEETRASVRFDGSFTGTLMFRIDHTNTDSPENALSPTGNPPKSPDPLWARHESVRLEELPTHSKANYV